MASCDSIKLTVQDVSQALGTEQFLQSGHFILQLTHQLIVGILIDDSITFDVLGSVSIAKIHDKLYLEGLENLDKLECKQLTGTIFVSYYLCPEWKLYRSVLRVSS